MELLALQSDSSVASSALMMKTSGDDVSLGGIGDASIRLSLLISSSNRSTSIRH